MGNFVLEIQHLVYILNKIGNGNKWKNDVIY